MFIVKVFYELGDLLNCDADFSTRGFMTDAVILEAVRNEDSFVAAKEIYNINSDFEEVKYIKYYNKEKLNDL